MKHKAKPILITITCFLLLSGCWDEKLIKDTRFILATAFDKREGKLTGTYTTPNPLNYPNSSIVTTVEGNTVREISLVINDKVAETLDTSKIKVVLFGEKLAKKDGIYPYLDIYIREPNNPINPYIVVVDGEASTYMTDPIPNESNPSEYFREVIKSHVDRGLFTHVNILKGSRIFRNSGFDILIPYFKKSQDKTPIIAGLAIFNKDKFTGKTLSPPDSVLFNLLNNSDSKMQPNIIVKIRSDKNPEIDDYLSVSILKSKRKLDVDIKDGKAIGKIDLQLKIAVVESPTLNVKKHRQLLTKAINKQLTKNANKLIKTLQEANSDGLAIGQHLHSFQNKEFEKLDWKGEAYKNSDIKAKVEVEIEKHGLID